MRSIVIRALRALPLVAAASVLSAGAALAQEEARASGPSAKPAAAADSTGAYETAVVTRRPELINRREVARSLTRHYPAVLRDAGVAGSVTVRIRVDEKGIPSRTLVAQTTNPAFNQPAVAVIQEMRFRPAQLDGRDVAVWVEIPVSFTIAQPLPQPMSPQQQRPQNGGIAFPR